MANPAPPLASSIGLGLNTPTTDCPLTHLHVLLPLREQVLQPVHFLQAGSPFSVGLHAGEGQTGAN